MFSEGKEHNALQEIQLHSEFILQWLVTGVMMMMVMMMTMTRGCLRAERDSDWF